MNERGPKIILTILLLAISVMGLVWFYWKRHYNVFTGTEQHLILSKKEASKLGKLHAEELLRQYHCDPPAGDQQQIMDRAGARILKFPALEKADYDFNFQLLGCKDSCFLDAFPDGSVLLSAGLFRFLKTEDQLAFLEAHAIGHIVARHYTLAIEAKINEGLFQQETISAILESKDGASGSQLFTELSRTKYSLHEELQADSIAVVLMNNAGYDINAGKSILKVFRNHIADPALSSINHTHPIYSERILE